MFLNKFLAYSQATVAGTPRVFWHCISRWWPHWRPCWSGRGNSLLQGMCSVWSWPVFVSWRQDSVRRVYSSHCTATNNHIAHSTNGTTVVMRLSRLESLSYASFSWCKYEGSVFILQFIWSLFWILGSNRLIILAWVALPCLALQKNCCCGCCYLWIFFFWLGNSILYKKQQSVCCLTKRKMQKTICMFSIVLPRKRELKQL